ncbi:MAG: mechanosensitive ion channel domain-containing protein [Bacteroidales bacterium]|jgi:miniconductance mechanosensitive channel|nr:mechanosensitive ion channel family protein [Bacteroidales bacterium]MCK9447702.1 mechanosensitive ion channel family protein [Bacteroidales bacterium]MDD3700207.1 mechanosensitive ion channel [Bacteroidales bacterium]MDY0370075.1 mechanosensitive ion channel [Bacteroidales bacterium]
MFENLINLFESILTKAGASEHIASLGSEAIAFISLLALSVVVYYVVWFIISRTLIVFIHRTKTDFDDILVQNKVIARATYFVPAHIILRHVAHTLPGHPEIAALIQQLTEIYITFVWIIFINSIISSLYAYYNTKEISKKRPAKGLEQVLKIVVYFLGGLLIIAQLFNRDISNLFLGLGTLSAVLMLIFKDPILGFVGGIQLSLNNMVTVGDWISMPKHNADGDVLEISLTSVKVQNWDKTITTIPTYTLVSDSFTNWRGMVQSGGRRIKRSLSIDMDSVRFCTPEMLERYGKFQLVSQYISDREKEITEYNQLHGIDTSTLVNGRRQTNLGIFRAYVTAYLRSHSRIHQDMTIMARHLQPTDKGIPIELYFFSNRQAWTEYEDLQSDIFDHLLAVIPMFDLQVFQVPSGASLEKAIRSAWIQKS